MKNENIINKNKIEMIIKKWSQKAKKYFELSEAEENPLSIKLTKSTVIALVNCIDELKKLIAESNYKPEDSQ